MKEGKNLASAGASNTPAENTNKNRLNACVDWVTCSFKFASDVQKVFNLIGISDLSALEKIDGSRYEFAGYDTTYKLGHIEMLYYDDRGIDNWLLNMSGQACRQFEISSSFDYIVLFGVLANINAVYTRLDIAIDDFYGYFTVNQFRNAVFNKQCVTRLSTWGDHRRGKIATGLDDITMNNFYLGGSKSRFFINVYDKKLERLDKGIEVKHKSWTRLEVRFKYEYADMFIVHMLENENTLGFFIKSFLNDKIVFLKPSVLTKDSNRSRLAKDNKNHARWWRDYLTGAGKLRLSKKVPEKTLNDSKEWLMRQVSITLAQLKIYLNDMESYEDVKNGRLRFDFLIDQLVEHGLSNMKKKHLRKIENQKYLDSQIVRFDKYCEDNKIVVSERSKEKILDEYWGMVTEQQKKKVYSTERIDLKLPVN